MTGFEPATPCSQSRCATKLRYIPLPLIITDNERLFNMYFLITKVVCIVKILTMQTTFVIILLKKRKPNLIVNRIYLLSMQLQMVQM